MKPNKLISYYSKQGLLDSSPAFENISNGSHLQPLYIPSFHFEANPRYQNINYLEYIYQKNISNFWKHFICSIPYIHEEFLRIAESIKGLCRQQRLQKLTLWETDTQDGSFAKALSESSTIPIYTLSNGIHKVNKQNFFKNLSHKQSFYFEGLLWDLTKQDLLRQEYQEHFTSNFDIIIETATFQFYGKHRISQISFLKQFLKHNGILICIEKIYNHDINEFLQREYQKDNEFKKRFFSDKDIENKKTSILNDMSYMVTLQRMVKSLKFHFRYVAVTWNSGNFYTFISSNDKKSFQIFLSELDTPIIPENYCYTEGLMLKPQIF
jgi:hypothetical protein